MTQLSILAITVTLLMAIPAWAGSKLDPETLAVGKHAVEALEDLGVVVSHYDLSSRRDFLDYQHRWADTDVIVQRFLRAAPDGDATIAIANAAISYQTARYSWDTFLLGGSDPAKTLQAVRDAWKRAAEATAKARELLWAKG